MKPSIEPYKPDRRLISAYEEATKLDEEGLKGLCPSYTELTEADTRFQDDVLLGRGAVKEVYKTFNNHTKRWIAMARLRADRGPEFYDLFVHEAWLTASLSHPNIITVHDAGIDHDDRPFFTMDLKGQSHLADRATGPHAAGRRELLEVFMKVCDAVAYAHSRGVVHLDLKPENIQADAFGEVLVCDWGLAKVIGEMEEGEADLPTSLRPLDNMTLMGQIKGSLGYMAPEQVVPGSLKDHRSDIFALGCMLHLILTGEPPFIGSEEKILEMTRRAEIASLHRRYPERHIPEALEAVVMKATARSPADRYDSAQTLRDEISHFLGGYSTLAEQPGFFREARLFLGRNRIPAAIGFLSIVALSVISVLFVQDIQRKQDAIVLEQARAEKFETQAETVETLYQDELDRSEQERRALAVKLVSSASNLKKLGIFIRPIETVRESHKLVDSAFALDDDCATALLQRFSLECITLDFKGAIKNPMKSDSSLTDYLLFVRAFPDFDYTEGKRPSVDQLVTFLQRAREINPRRVALMERIVTYDYAARSDKEAYAPVVEALLDYVNEQQGAARLLLDSDGVNLTVRSEQRIRLAVWDQWGSNECLLRFLPFRTLKPEFTERFQLGDLEALRIETLDLRGCATVTINHPVSLPHLRKVHIRPGQLDPDVLRASIKTREWFEIIEAASGAGAQ